MKRASDSPEWFEKIAPDTQMLDFLLDENRSPVARMRLFSEGVNENHRILAGDGPVSARSPDDETGTGAADSR